jgi:hypothetical protein
MEVLGYHMLKKHSRDEGLVWEVFLQGLDVTGGELVNATSKECENPFTNPTSFFARYDQRLSKQ